MSLADFVIRTETVTFGESSRITVRGLGLDDVTVLLHEKLNDLDEIMAVYGDSVNDRVAIGATAQYAISLVKRSPELAATIIALASDEPDQVARARRLPIAVQIKLIDKIVELTFVDAGGVKNFGESLIQLISRVRPATNQTGLST